MLTSIKLAVHGTCIAVDCRNARAATIGARAEHLDQRCSFPMEAQARVMRKFEEDLGYGQTGNFCCD